jgi:hypothetical protein
MMTRGGQDKADLGAGCKGRATIYVICCDPNLFRIEGH